MSCHNNNNKKISIFQFKIEHCKFVIYRVNLSFQSLIRGKSLNRTRPYTDFNEVSPAQEQQELPWVQALHVEEKQEHSIGVCHYYC